MGQDGSQSPEKLLPDPENRSDRTPATEENTTRSRGMSFNSIQRQPPQPPWYESLSPIRFTSPPTTTASAADGIPLYPILPMPYNAHPDNNNNNNTGVAGIMALTNFGFGGNNNNNNKNRGNTPPPRKFTFSVRSPQIAPVNSAVLDNSNVGTHPCPPQTPPDQQRGIHYHYGRRLQWLVPTVVMINSLMLVITMYENDCPHTSLHPDRCVLKFLNRLSFQPFNENPLLGPSWKALLSIGALNSNLVTNGGQGWRLLTAVWLHAGLFHLLANMFGLMSIGRRLEKEFGWIKMATIYLVAGFGGSLLSALFMQNQISVGASGALMGLLGATVAEVLINWSSASTSGGENSQQRSRSLAALLLMVTVNLSFGLMPHVDNFAHIGGLCAGSLLGCILLMKPRSAWIMNQPWIIGHGGLEAEVPTTSGPRHSSVQNAARYVALGLLLFSYGMGILALFKGYGMGARSTCKWCKYMSCVPSFLWDCRNP